MLLEPPTRPDAPPDDPAGRPAVAHLHRQRWRLLRQVDTLIDRPMIALAFAWLVLLVLDFTRGLSPALQMLSNAIWALFVVDFAIEFTIAPRKLAYLRRNWLTAVALLLPALRVLRAFRALRVLRAARAARSVSLLRLVTSLNRGMGALRHTLARHAVGYVAALTLVVTFAGAAGMFRFESPRSLREEGYPGERGLASYGEALWWTAMIMTTMGSEAWPRTAEGRLLCLGLSIYAFAIFGYLTATIASFFLGRPEPDEPPVTAEDLAALRAELAALRRELADRSAPSASGGDAPS